WAQGTYSSVTQNVKQSENTVYQQGKANWTEHGYALNLTQPLFDMVVYRKWRKTQADERQAVASFAYAQQDLMLRVAKACLDILAAKAQLRLTKAQRDTIRQQLTLVKARYQAGKVTSVQMNEAQARLAVQDANYSLAKSSYADK